MRAAVFYSRDDIRFDEVPVPKIGRGELLLRAHTIGLCGTDVTKIVNQSVRPGTVLGHELAGVVEEVGDGLTGYKVGQRVVALHHVPCGACWFCQHGDFSMCRHFKTSNFEPGGFAEYVRIPASNVQHGVFRIPDETSFEAATFTEPLACCIRVPQRSNWRPGDNVMVVGAGPVGQLLLQCAKLYLAATWVTDVVEERLKMAREFGADHVLSPQKDDVMEAVRDATHGVGLDGLILTAPGQPVWDQAIRWVRDGGVIHLFAVKASGAPTTVDLNDLLVRQIQVHSTYSSTPVAARESLSLISRGLVRVEELISHRLPLSELAAAVGMAVRREGRKIVIQA